MTDLTEPAAWADALAAHPPRALDPAGLGRLVVGAAHPDDETLAASGVLRAVHAAGGRVELVVATDGEAAFPDHGPAERAELGRARRREMDDALAAQGLGAVPVTWLGMPDSALDADALAAALVPLLDGADSYLAPWPHDPHPDHAAAGRAAAQAAAVTVHGWTYPIWMWAWLEPSDPRIPWDRAFTLPLDGDARAVKRRAIGCFRTQLPEILPPEVLRYFETGTELLFRTPPERGAPLSRFDELYAGGDGDPWSTRSSWYERRKRAVLLACLPREHYRHAAEPGCGTGALTRELAGRCDRLDAADFSAAAVAQAVAATAGLPGVTVTGDALPDPRTLPAGIDLAVLSEVLYYLGDDELSGTVDRVADAVVPGGDVVLAHWRGWPAEAPRDAVATHRWLQDDPRFAVLVEHTDAEFLLHVLRRR